MAGGYVPYKPYGPSSEAMNLAMLLQMMGQKDTSKTKEGGIDLKKGGAGGAGIFGGLKLFGGGEGSAGMSMADLSLPEIESLASSGGLPMSVGPTASFEGGMSVGPSAFAPGSMAYLGPAAVALTPMIGKAIGKALIGNKDPYVRRQYSRDDFTNRNKIAMKGFDSLSAEDKGRAGDLLSSYGGKKPLITALDRRDGAPTDRPDWTFELPSFAQKKVNREVMGTEKGWGTRASRDNMMGQYSPTEIFDMGKSEMNPKHREEIGNILSQVQALIDGRQIEQPTPAPTSMPRGVATTSPETMSRLLPASLKSPNLSKWGY